MQKDKHIADLRKSYELGELDEASTANEPLRQFEKWFNEAIKSEVNEPNAMTLATVDVSGRPACRPVLIKGYDAQGIVWFTNYQSRKGQALAVNPYAALQFFWPELERVIRIEGRVEKVAGTESDAYYQTRPLGSRIGAWASPQSEIIESRTLIAGRAAKYATQFGLNPPRPEHWGGYRLVPDYWEFWQGRASRLHDRIVYRLDDNGQWQHQRLAP
ncbi:pyridoxamine 5'-phosphate oxidase [Methylophaga sp. OBS3]|uniref:pyridoxamine 5'-phosphate oxidase n=1 Tax=Methylophaga sp. OBS3 TaxID=2991934 RepID=UPI002256B5FA|nr:pyridoxamine 5'-phosphate oxidase [Methylophaga sp. OBS3]MCX4189707.1 pyridoxamine 5'-phosphate oxidase [Methylophaga sp. OBS3]